MGFAVFWFIAIAVLWTGFFVLEGFDFGVGMLHEVIGHNDVERRLVINTIGPLWDGNEVWLIVAGAGMFAAFPDWYATMFSGFYVALVLLLVALILRGVSFEYRGKRDGQAWRRTWDWIMAVCSLLAPFLVGVALANLLRGVPINSSQEFTGNFLTLLNPYSLYVGLTVTAICVLHGATFIALKTTDPIRERARTLGKRSAPVVAVLVLGFAVWTQIEIDRGVVPGIPPTAAVIAILAVIWLLAEGHEGWAFGLTTFTMAATIFTLFADLYPRVMVSSTNAAYSLTVSNASSAPYSLKVMTVVAVIFLPLVLVYQAWTYYVFRRRISVDDLEIGVATDTQAGPASVSPGT